MRIQELVEKYLPQIQVEDTDFIPIDYAVSDAAYLYLILPLEMLREYQKLIGDRKKLPDGVRFWSETKLVERLRDCGKYSGQGHADLNDVLDYLGGDVWSDCSEIGVNKIRLSITEIPEFNDQS